MSCCGVGCVACCFFVAHICVVLAMGVGVLNETVGCSDYLVADAGLLLLS